jgi:hypothetical protein
LKKKKQEKPSLPGFDPFSHGIDIHLDFLKIFLKKKQEKPLRPGFDPFQCSIGQNRRAEIGKTAGSLPWHRCYLLIFRV